MKVVILTILKDSTSYGAGRSIKDYMDMIKSIDYPKDLLKIEILVSDEEEASRIRDYVKGDGSALKTEVHYHKDSVSIPRERRHDDDVQGARRSMLARIRNHLIDLADLKGSYAVLWVDSDLIYIPPGILKTMLVSDRDIIMPFCGEGTDKHRDYDLNAYKIVDGKRVQLKALYSEDPNNQLIEIDSVGGTLLFVRSSVHLNGVRFSEEPVKNKAGFDVLETEGLCIEAQKLGYRCWFLNGERNAVLHYLGDFSIEHVPEIIEKAAEIVTKPVDDEPRYFFYLEY